jgi:hypothetical protein
MRLLRFTLLMLTLLLFTVSAHADTVTYTFEQPGFLVANTTPIVRSPNSGPADFEATFTSAPEASAFIILDSDQPNVLMVGQYFVLHSDFSPGNVLTITLNMPINSLSVNFAVQNPGQLVLTSSVGSTSQNSGIVGGTSQGGILSFSTATPIFSFQLAAFDSAGNPTRFAIDNLLIETASAPVPEPTAIFLLATGLAGALIKARRSTTRKRRS